ncbi:hypothetical protein NCCP2145_14060 [Pseudarthrobacter sp. NCCP-2145]|nr:hypothetical protein NCCP2145_14060 [Pseudarthrobacter sp. NCCP-2145]
MQYLLGERDALWLAAGTGMRERLLKLRETDDYTYLSLPEIAALQASQKRRTHNVKGSSSFGGCAGYVKFRENLTGDRHFFI